MAQLQVELERMNAENQKLRGMLNQVNNNYSSLQMHLVSLMQQQRQQQQQRSRKSENQLELPHDQVISVYNFRYS